MNIQQDEIFGDFVTDPNDLIAYYREQEKLPDTGLVLCPIEESNLFTSERLGENAQTLNCINLHPGDGCDAIAFQRMAEQLKAMTKPQNLSVLDFSAEEVEPSIHFGRALDEIAQDDDYSRETTLPKIMAEESKVVAFLSRPAVQAIVRGNVHFTLSGPRVRL